MTGGLFAILDDTAAMSKVAAKKTAGLVVGGVVLGILNLFKRMKSVEANTGYNYL